MADKDGFLTVDELAAETEFDATLSSGRKVKCRRIARAEYLALLAVPPEEAAGWPKPTGPKDEVGKAAYRKAEADWLRRLPAEEQIRQQQRMNDVRYRTIALAALRPALTLDQARRLGDDAELLFAEILKHSGMLEAEPPAEDAPADPAGAEGADRAA